jgi:hypothetical protein
MLEERDTQNVSAPKTVHFPYIYGNLWGFGGFVCVTYNNVHVQKYVAQDGKCTETRTLTWCRMVLPVRYRTT